MEGRFLPNRRPARRLLACEGVSGHTAALGDQDSEGTPRTSGQAWQGRGFSLVVNEVTLQALGVSVLADGHVASTK